jgi:hypothetical protein
MSKITSEDKAIIQDIVKSTLELYGLIKPTVDEVTHVKCVKFNGSLNEIIIGKIYPVKKIISDEGAYVFLDELRFTFLHHSEYEASDLKAYQNQQQEELIPIAKQKYPFGTILKNNGLCPSSNPSNGIIGSKDLNYINDELWVKATDGYHLKLWDKKTGKWAEIEKTKWKPKYGDLYWVVNLNFEPEEQRWYDYDYDKEVYKNNNCFPTKQLAQIACDKIKQILK